MPCIAHVFDKHRTYFSTILLHLATRRKLYIKTMQKKRRSLIYFRVSSTCHHNIMYSVLIVEIGFVSLFPFSNFDQQSATFLLLLFGDGIENGSCFVDHTLQFTNRILDVILFEFRFGKESINLGRCRHADIVVRLLLQFMVGL